MSFLAEVEFDDTAHLTALIVGETDAIAARVCDEIVTVAQEYVPIKTGALHDSIHTGEEGGEHLVLVDSDYAAYVEYGTSVNRAQPYLEPAIEEVSQSAGDFGAEMLGSAVQ